MGNSPTHTAEEISTEKSRFLDMCLAEKRLGYKEQSYERLENVKPWAEYHQQNIHKSERVPASRHRYRPNASLNRIVSVWSGDLTELEVDAIVNSAANPDKGGEVNTAIMKRAGEFYVDECLSTGLAEPGEVLLTGGYKLPARYVINTLAPRTQDSALLLNCYRNSLDTAKENGISTVAFPCIATRKKNAFPKRKAAELVLTTVRNWLQNNPNALERIIFCLYLEEDLKVYEQVMQEFFPIPSEEPEGPGSHRNIERRVTTIGVDESPYRHTTGSLSTGDTRKAGRSCSTFYTPSPKKFDTDDSHFNY